MRNYSMYLAWIALISMDPHVVMGQVPAKEKVDVLFSKSNVPATLVPNDVVHIQQILSSKLKGDGTLVQSTRDLVKDLEVLKVDRNPTPPESGVKVTFRVEEGLKRKLTEMMEKAPRIKDKAGVERIFLPLRVELARARLSGLAGRAEEIVKEGVVRLDRVGPLDPADKKARLTFGKEVRFELDLYIGELRKESILPAEGTVVNSKKMPVDAVYVLTFFDEKGNVVTASTARIRGIYEGKPRSVVGAAVKGREEDFRSIARYRFYACISPSVEPAEVKDVASESDIPTLIPKLLLPVADGSVLNPNSKYTQWTFRWEPVAGASLYQLQVQRSGTPQPWISMQTSQPSYTKRDMSPFPVDEWKGWTWKVRAFVNDRWEGWSEERSFALKAFPRRPVPKKVEKKEEK